MVTCTLCNEDKAESEFSRDKHNVNGRVKQCKDCRRAYNRQYSKDCANEIGSRKKKTREASHEVFRYRETRTKVRAWAYSEAHAEEVMLLWMKRSGLCNICGVSEETLSRLLSIDHDHDKGLFRGFLCASCNSGLGMFGDGKNERRRGT